MLHHCASLVDDKLLNRVELDAPNTPCPNLAFASFFSVSTEYIVFIRESLSKMFVYTEVCTSVCML